VKGPASGLRSRVGSGDVSRVGAAQFSTAVVAVNIGSRGVGTEPCASGESYAIRRRRAWSVSTARRAASRRSAAANDVRLNHPRAVR